MSKATTRFVVAASLLAALAVPSWAQSTPWQIDPAHSVAQFSVRHMMISNIKGEFSKLAGVVNLDEKDPTRSTVEVSIDTTTINTRVPKRDADLRGANFLDVEKYPTMTFRSKRIVAVDPGRYKLTGDLTIHGVTREVTFDVEGPTPAIKDPHGNVRVGASATAKISRKDFGLTWNAPLESGGVVVGDDVTITVDVELVKKAAPAPAKSGN